MKISPWTTLFFSGVVATSFIFSGCSSKQYFEPEKTFSASNALNSYGGTIVDLSRDGATLKNRKYIGKAGINNIDLGEGYRFLSESDSYVLAGNPEGILKIIDKKSKEAIRAVSLHVPIVSATIKDGVIAYILNNNAFGIYQIADNRKVVESRSERTFAIDTRAASPMFIDNLAVMPMLDGKLIIVNGANTEEAKVIYLSSEKVFNNVVYLSRTGNTMVAATPKKLISIGNAGQKEYRANISEVVVDGKNIYLFTKEGEIIHMDTTLNVLAKQKFKYAHFAASTAFDGRVFALDQQGSLIVLSRDLSKYRIYDLDDVGSPVFITGSKLYKDGKIIELSKLGYE
jgi:hypothetical protein